MATTPQKRTAATTGTSREELSLTRKELDAYQKTVELLEESASFLAPFPAVVSLRDLVQEPLSGGSNTTPAATPPALGPAASALSGETHISANLSPSHNISATPAAATAGQSLTEEPPTSLLSPNKGHHALFRSLEELEGLEKEEATLVEHSPLTGPLTQVVTGNYAPNARAALAQLEEFGSIPRRVCQHPFKRNDIVWVCRTCQADETCVLCHSCFSQSNHEGHDVAFYHAQAGGCCDCGDPDAWDPAGFCPHHGPAREHTNTTTLDAPLSSDQVQRVRGVVPSVVDWMVERIAKNAEAGYQRAISVSQNQPVFQDIEMGGILPESQNQEENLVQNNLQTSEEADHNEENDEIFATQPGMFSPVEGSTTNRPLHLQHQHPAQLGNQRAWTTPSSTINSSPRLALDSSLNPNNRHSVPEKLGKLGRDGHGLYLVLYADDVHSPSQWIEVLRDFLGASSYYTDSLLAKFVRALRQYGQLVVWGTMELVAECGITNADLWLDGDSVAGQQISNALLRRAKKLIANGFFCSIFTRKELQLEQRAVAVLQWMSALARSCDPLCQTVAECILPNRHLVPLLRADFKLSARITKAWYSLLLTLLAVPAFKSHLAAAYCDTYRSVTAKYAAGMGLLERSAYTLSVQFLNRVTYVVDLVQGRDLLGKLGKSLLETLRVAQSEKLQGRLNPNHFVLSHRRYSPCISDLKCVLNVKGMKRLFACQEGTFLQDWVAALSLAQFMDTQVWRHWTQGHVEDEVRGWVGAFNLSISLGSLFERLLSWEDEEPSPIKDPASPLSGNLLSCVQLTYHIIVHGISPWQEAEMSSCQPTLYTSAIDPHKRCSASLPFSTIAAKHGCSLALYQLPIAQVTPFSFHLPLHRFLAACIREVCLRERSHVEMLMTMISSRLTPSQQDALWRGLMEWPVLVLSRSSQVRAGLWRRNGPGLNDQVLNYAEPPFCRSMRDADLLLVQFAVLKRTMHQSPSQRPESDVGVAFLVHLVLHRLGIFDFSGLTKAPNADINRYLLEVSGQLYPHELRPESSIHDHDIVLPWTYSPARDAATRLVLLEEFLHLMVIFVVELPPMPPANKEDHTNQAKQRLRREVIHRLASGPKTHSELSEVHLVLSHWDNVFLSEEGKLVNPDDATGAALGAVLEEVADRKLSRGKLEPDKWELRRSAWEAYDPSFFHISLRSHQTAAEGRPHSSKNTTKGTGSGNPYGDAKPYGPIIVPAHPCFERLRRDVTADATLLAVAYRILHLHCRHNKEKDFSDLRSGKFAYENDERSETALARAVHILTLGIQAWEKADADCQDWRSHGGGSAGSVFFNRPDNVGGPAVSDWIEAALVADPGELLDCEWYLGEEKAIVLLRRLAVDGGMPGCFVAGDRSIRSGAAWICEFALKHCPAASVYLGKNNATTEEKREQVGDESELQKKKRLAKERAMARMKDQAAKFASMMKVELDEGDEKDNTSNMVAGNNLSFSSVGSEAAMDITEAANPSHHHPSRSSSLGSTRSLSSTSVEASGAESDRSLSATTVPLIPDASTGSYDDPAIPDRLLKVRPQCIICNDESNADSRVMYAHETGIHKKSRPKKTGGGNALCFVAYAQASTVLKGGGGPPCRDESAMSPVRRFVGTHVALCGHAVHSECCEAYLAIVSHREDRVIGKRDEFRCPLCQRLSNCLVPFIDVGEDWICSPASSQKSDSDQLAAVNTKSNSDVDMLSFRYPESPEPSTSLQDFLKITPWWVSRHNPLVVWDGQSAFISRSSLPAPGTAIDRNLQAESLASPSKPRRRSVRSLRKKDLYAAWNAMMRTPRFVRRKLRHRSRDESSTASRGHDVPQSYTADQDETTGETVVWRRFMDQVCDVAYRADSKRLGEDNLHGDFGEFRHYIIEKFSYNLAKRSAGIDPADWPSCVFSTTLSEIKRQELSREKLLSKLLMTIQAFTYSCCCEASEARRAIRKHMLSSRQVAGLSDSSNLEAICSKFGISGVLCDGKMVIIPDPSSTVDDGSQPFNGRIGRLRYLALAAMAAAGAVAADLVQLVLCFPLNRDQPANDMDIEKPDRAPIAYPILLGNVLTHVVAAMTASCGRARARSDSLELVWPVPFSVRGSFAFADSGNDRQRIESVIEDCEGFLKLGLLARILQVLLAALAVTPGNIESAIAVVFSLKGIRVHQDDNMSQLERTWVLSCFSLMEAALGESCKTNESRSSSVNQSDVLDSFNEACFVAAGAACHFLVDISTVLQVLIPGVMSRYETQSAQMASPEWDADMSLRTFEKMRTLLEIESVGEMLQSTSVVEIVANWFQSAHDNARAATASSSTAMLTTMLDEGRSIRHRLYRTQGYRAFDWPMQSSLDWVKHLGKSKSSQAKSGFKADEAEPQHERSVSTMQVEAMLPDETPTPTAEVLRQQASPSLVTFSAKKTVPLIGGHRDETQAKINGRPRVAVIPTSYTDLYAELGALLPDCEQTAVCLICGEVLNAGGKSECTRHSYKCGAGAGLFFLLQECSGLIMHKGKAAYIHSPYVDSHGETPQYRGRPLNLDLARYDHLREVWSGHGVRQQVLAERGSSRQVIVPDFY